MSTDEISEVLLGHECILHVEGYISQWPRYSKATRWVTPPSLYLCPVQSSNWPLLWAWSRAIQISNYVGRIKAPLLSLYLHPAFWNAGACGNLVQVSLVMTETLQERRVQSPQGVIAECSLPMALFQLGTSMCGIFCEPRKVTAKHPSPVRDAK